MLYISDDAWTKYIALLRKINDAAGAELFNYLSTHEWWRSKEAKQAAIDYAYGIATRYGEAGEAVVCEFYDMIVSQWADHILPSAVPAKTANYSEVAKAFNGTSGSLSEQMMADAVARLVKVAQVDTLMQNAIRDGAEWAWIPHGETCPYCLMLASRGWQNASKKAIKNGHAEHIHANCDCTYAVRFSENQNVEGYDPNDYRKLYYAADGNTPEERINAMRRIQYKLDKDKINAQKRAAYARHKEMEEVIAESERA